MIAKMMAYLMPLLGLGSRSGGGRRSLEAFQSFLSISHSLGAYRNLPCVFNSWQAFLNIYVLDHLRRFHIGEFTGYRAFLCP